MNSTLKLSLRSSRLRQGLVVMSLVLNGLQSMAANKDLKKEFETLGDNKEVVERVKNLDHNQKIRIVQSRLVDRNNRVELAMSYAYLGNADSYVKTQNFGGRLEYHINPRWSVGAQYQKYYNSLTAEGQNQYDRALEAQRLDPASPQRFPAIDYPLQSTMATVSFYPVYGKLNLFDSGIAQFDLYVLLGYGQMSLLSGSTQTMAAGLGTGIWLNRWLTARAEIRYQKYQDLLKTERRDENVIQGVASLGILVW